MKIIAMIPARIGSERLKYKNLALLNNKPLIYYVIEEAKKSKIFDEIYVNSDHEIFRKISKRYNISFYKRDQKLGGAKIKSDEVVFNFLNNVECDLLVWLNPIAPLQEAKEIRKVIKYFINNKLNSLITTNKVYRHAIFKKKYLNFKNNEKFAKTQDLDPIEQFVYSIMMWSSKSFRKNYYNSKGAIIHGKFKTFEVSQNSGLIVKNSFDLKLIENIIKNKNKDINKVKYDKLINTINVQNKKKYL